MTTRFEVLETLAKEEVGKADSPFSFVNVQGTIKAVFVDDLRGAIRYADSLPSGIPTYVESANGVEWDNEASAALQRTCDGSCEPMCQWCNDRADEAGEERY